MAIHHVIFLILITINCIATSVGAVAWQPAQDAGHDQPMIIVPHPPEPDEYEEEE